MCGNTTSTVLNIQSRQQQLSYGGGWGREGTWCEMRLHMQRKCNKSTADKQKRVTRSVGSQQAMASLPTMSGALVPLKGCCW